MGGVYLIASVTASDWDAYSNLLVIVTSIMLELIIFNKKPVMALEESIRLDICLIQFQNNNSTGGSRENVGGGVPLRTKRGVLLLVMQV